MCRGAISDHKHTFTGHIQSGTLLSQATLTIFNPYATTISKWIGKYIIFTCLILPVLHFFSYVLVSMPMQVIFKRGLFSQAHPLACMFELRTEGFQEVIAT